MNLFPLLQEQTPIDPQNWTDKQKFQHRFGGTRYQFQGPSDLVDRDFTLQAGSNCTFPRGEEDVSQTINQETIDKNNS